MRRTRRDRPAAGLAVLGTLTMAAILMGIVIWLIIASLSSAQVLASRGTTVGGLRITWRRCISVAGRSPWMIGRSRLSAVPAPAASLDPPMRARAWWNHSRAEWIMKLSLPTPFESAQTNMPTGVNSQAAGPASCLPRCPKSETPRI